MICDDKTLVNWHWSWFLSLSEFHISRLNICDIFDIVNIVNIVGLAFSGHNLFWTKFWQIKTHCTENSLCVWFKPSLTASRWTWKLRVDTFVLWCPWKGWGANGGQWGRHREVSKQKLLLKRLLTIFTLFWKSFWRSSWQRNCVADFKKNLWPGIWI